MFQKFTDGREEHFGDWRKHGEIMKRRKVAHAEASVVVVSEYSPGLKSAPFPESIALRRVGLAIAAVLWVFIIRGAESYWGIASGVIAGLGIGLFFLLDMLWPYVFVPGTLRVSCELGSLQLKPDKGGVVSAWLLTGLGVCWGLAAVVLVVREYLEDPATFALAAIPRSVFGVIAMALTLVVILTSHVIQHSRVPNGIYISEAGIVASGEGKIHRVDWSDLHRVTIVQGKHLGLKLTVLNNQMQKVASISPRSFGSDPMPTAALIHYFRDHPEERHLLSDPERAIERFLMSLRSS